MDEQLPPQLEQRVRADAAVRAGVPEERVRLVQVEGRDWPDTSLGCPEPGTVYAQVITPGYQVLVEADGRRLDYRADTRSNVVLCEDGVPTAG